jgi:hypothetical protein
MIKFCKNCQVETERNPSGRCKPCKKARDAAYYAANRQRSKTNGLAWQRANPDKRKAHRDAWIAKNPDKERARKAAWQSANHKNANAAARRYRSANPDKVKASQAAWHAENPMAKRIIDQNRRARKRAAGGKLSPGLASKLFKLQRGKCACGCKQPLGDDYHMDHRMPIALGGSNTDDNIQLLRSICNQKKHAKHPTDFMQERGFLI